jgi:hypothetical protein
VRIQVVSVLNYPPYYVDLGGSGCIAPCILNLGSRWRLVVSFTPPPLYPRGKSPWYPTDKRQHEPQSRLECCREEKTILNLPGFEPKFLDFSVWYGWCSSLLDVDEEFWSQILFHLKFRDVFSLKWIYRKPIYLLTRIMVRQLDYRLISAFSMLPQ